jgi:hypothetical protein
MRNGLLCYQIQSLVNKPSIERWLALEARRDFAKLRSDFIEYFILIIFLSGLHLHYLTPNRNENLHLKRSKGAGLGYEIWLTIIVRNCSSTFRFCSRAHPWSSSCLMKANTKFHFLRDLSLVMIPCKTLIILVSAAAKFMQQ